MSEEKQELIDLGDELEALGKVTMEALADDAKDILKDVARSGPRVKELSKEVFDWKLKALREDNEEKQLRYDHEYEVAKAAMATRLIDEKLVATTKARDTFLKRFDEFGAAALDIGAKVVKIGVKITAKSLLSGLGGDIGDKILSKI